jgi:Flp pilus assembly protein TadD
MTMMAIKRLSLLGGLFALLGVAWPTFSLSAAEAPSAHKRRQPPPAVIPTEELTAAKRLYDGRNYQGAVAQAKAALNKNERYTPAMLIMARAYFKLGKYEWVKTLGDMMKNAGASEAERADIYQMMAFMEVEKENTAAAIKLFRKAAEARPDNAILWNNLGAQYLVVKNYREAVPVLERSVQLQPTFAKAHMNLGSAYRGIKRFDQALAEYKQSLALFPRYADVVYNLAILHLDADKMPNMDETAKLNAAISYFEQYRKMLQGAGQSVPPEVDAYIAEAQDGIKKEQRRIEREKKRAERERQRAAQKAADDAKKAAGAPPTPTQGVVPTPNPTTVPGPAPGYPPAPAYPPAAPSRIR